MKYIIAIWIMVAALCSLWAEDYRLINTKNGKAIDIVKMANDLAKYDLVFFGEFHGNETIHKLELEVLQLLHQKRPKLIVSMEMFERDTQEYLDMYLNNEMDEEEFILNSRIWQNYPTDYRPLVEYSKAMGLSVLAANIPRYLAGRAVRNVEGFYDSLTERERAYSAREVNAPDDRYRDLFFETMEAGSAHGMPGDAAMYQRLYYAQCLKDDTMAESIVAAMNANPKSKLSHFNGDFHSRYYLGTVQRVLLRSPKLKIAVISPFPVDDLNAYRHHKENRKIANYLILINQNTED